jgi:predicted nucleic acid-binding protein
MKERSFIDTNILVYTDDADSPEKSRLAIDLVENAMRTNLGVISTQVLQEYFVAATHKLNVDITIAKRRTQLFSRMHVIQVTPEDVISAINLVQLHNLSFWDSLILHAAGKAGCSVLLTEDMNHDQIIDGIRIENPFI